VTLACVRRHDPAAAPVGLARQDWPTEAGGSAATKVRPALRLRLLTSCHVVRASKLPATPGGWAPAGGQPVNTRGATKVRDRARRLTIRALRCNLRGKARAVSVQLPMARRPSNEEALEVGDSPRPEAAPFALHVVQRLCVKSFRAAAQLCKVQVQHWRDAPLQLVLVKAAAEQVRHILHAASVRPRGRMLDVSAARARGGQHVSKGGARAAHSRTRLRSIESRPPQRHASARRRRRGSKS
jgi:hypothetical protein